MSKYKLTGWSMSQDNTPVPDVLENVASDMTVYACYEELPTQYWYNADGSLLAETNYEMGSVAEYPYGTPENPYENTGWPFSGWNSELTVNAMVMSFYAQYVIPTGWETDTTWDVVRDKLDQGDVSDLLGQRFLSKKKNNTYTAVQIVGIKTTSGALLDCIERTILNSSQYSNQATGGGSWGSGCTIAVTCHNQKADFSDEIQERMIETTKYSYVNTSGMTYTDSESKDTIWIPSMREMNYSTVKETKGPTYSSVYNSNQKKIKYNKSGTAVKAWLRSWSYASGGWARGIGTDGTDIYEAATTSNGVCHGFCLKSKT